MQPVEVHWVAIFGGIMTTLGAFIPKISEWITGRKKDKQSDVEFVITNLKDLTNNQGEKLNKMETRLLDMQQKLIDMQTAHVQTLVENVTMKGQIQALTTENVSLRAKVEDLERRVQK